MKEKRYNAVTLVLLSLLSFEPDGQSCAIKAFINPLVSWLWWSLPLLCLGTAIALYPQRRSLSVALLGRAVARTP